MAPDVDVVPVAPAPLFRPPLQVSD